VSVRRVAHRGNQFREVISIKLEIVISPNNVVLNWKSHTRTRTRARTHSHMKRLLGNCYNTKLGRTVSCNFSSVGDTAVAVCAAGRDSVIRRDDGGVTCSLSFE
jgi:hypothetical protein